MNELKQILDWLTRNYFKLMVLLLSIMILYFLVIFLLPIFHFFSFFYEIGEKIINFFLEIEKTLDELKWEKIKPRKENEEA